MLVFCMSENAFGAEWATLETQALLFQDPLNRQRRFFPLRPIKPSVHSLQPQISEALCSAVSCRQRGIADCSHPRCDGG